MAKYNYSRYTALRRYKEAPWGEAEYRGIAKTVVVFPSYSFSGMDKYFDGVGTSRIAEDCIGIIGTFYYMGNSGRGLTLRELKNIEDNPDLSTSVLATQRSKSHANHTEYYIRGALEGTNIEAENGTYPNDGRHTDGYWYVRGSIITHTVTFKDWNGTTLKTQTVNDGSSATAPSNPSRTGYTFSGWSGTYTNVTSSRTITATYSYIPVPPSRPSSITVPTDVKGGYDLYISWGSSTGVSRYYLYRSIDSGGYVSIYSGTSRNYTDTIPKGTSTVSYRVRAYNSDGYSSYRTSAVIDVRNFPELFFRVNGNLTTSEGGWVRINGELKEIDTIWTMVNGILKEVQ